MAIEEDLSAAQAELLRNFQDLGGATLDQKAALDAAKTGISGFDRGLKLAGKAAADLGKSLSDYAGSVRTSKDGLVDLGGVYDNTSKAAQLTVAGLSKLAGASVPLAFAFTKVTEATFNYIKAADKNANELYKAFQGVSRSGGIAADGIRGLANDAIKLGYGMVDLSDYVQQIGENSKDLSQMSGNVREGAKQFANVGKTMEGYREGLMAAGMTQKEINDGALGYIRLQTRLGQTQRKSTEELSQGIHRYLIEQDALTKLTGLNRKEQEDARQRIMEEEQFLGTLISMRKSGADGERAAEQLQQFLVIVGEKAPKASQGLTQLASGVQVTEGARQQMMLTAGEAGKILEMIKSGQISAAKGMDLYSQSVKRVVDTQGESLMRNRVFSQTMGDAYEASQLANLAQKSYAKNLNEITRDQINSGILGGKASDASTANLTETALASQRAKTNIDEFVNMGLRPATGAANLLSRAFTNLTNVLPGGANPLASATPTQTPTAPTPEPTPTGAGTSGATPGSSAGGRAPTAPTPAPVPAPTPAARTPAPAPAPAPTPAARTPVLAPTPAARTPVPAARTPVPGPAPAAQTPALPTPTPAAPVSRSPTIAPLAASQVAGQQTLADELKDVVFSELIFARQDRENYKKYVARKNELYEKQIKELEKSGRVTPVRNELAEMRAGQAAIKEFQVAATAAGAMSPRKASVTPSVSLPLTAPSGPTAAASSGLVPTPVVAAPATPVVAAPATPAPAAGAADRRPVTGRQPPVASPLAPTARAQSGTDNSVTKEANNAEPPKKAAQPVKVGLTPNMSDDEIKKMIIAHEGIRYRPYQDSLGLWTVGVGHLIGDGKTLPPEWDREFSRDEVMAMFEKDYAEHKAAAASKTPNFSQMTGSGQAAFTDLTFNMGPNWLSKFPNTKKAVEGQDNTAIASGLANSKWATQVGNRAATIIELARNSFPMAADGGIFDSPVIAAEAGPEAVIPLKNGSVPVKLDMGYDTKKAQGIGQPVAGTNEWTGYNMKPMTTDLKALEQIAGKLGAYDAATKTITDPKVWKEVLQSGMMMNYNLSVAEIGTKGFGNNIGIEIGERIKEIAESKQIDISEAISAVRNEFKDAMSKMLEAFKPADPEIQFRILDTLQDISRTNASTASTSERMLTYTQN